MEHQFSYTTSPSCTCIIPSIIQFLQWVPPIYQLVLGAYAAVGVCLGRKNHIQNPPPYHEVVQICKNQGIQRIRLYEADSGMLYALAGSKIEVMLGIPNECIKTLSINTDSAEKWVTDNIYPSVDFKYIVVGNEIDLATEGSVLLKAMQNILEALRNQGLQIYVTTAIGPQLLSDHSFNPPSKAVFQDNVLGSMGNILEFLDKSGYPLLVNVHPFKRYVATANPDLQILNFALFNYSNIMIVDGDRVYHNLFDAMFASLRAAVNKASKDTPFKRGLVISETGWPTAGFGTATSVPNAMTFNCKIIERIKKDLISTPVYIHSLFDEKWKSTINEWDKYWGLLETDGRFKS
ncbi:Glycoside hydrolase family 17 [Dillenia turbinata]|uniref:Glycoside hydrolase family 17 n=1 Tax=Dillenia turbinata TaxID=194707 RepID=A0AAN8W2N5_9MAGN